MNCDILGILRLCVHVEYCSQRERDKSEQEKRTESASVTVGHLGHPVFERKRFHTMFE